jgi:hypothetical protein
MTPELRARAERFIGPSPPPPTTAGRKALQLLASETSGLQASPDRQATAKREAA